MSRPSKHVEPHGALATARHYVRELVYGANDGIITTFAVVAGVAGGGLSARVVFICGVANLLADGLSMAVGNYLSIRSHESVLSAEGLPEEEAYPWRHGLATFLAFVHDATPRVILTAHRLIGRLQALVSDMTDPPALVAVAFAAVFMRAPVRLGFTLVLATSPRALPPVALVPVATLRLGAPLAPFVIA